SPLFFIAILKYLEFIVCWFGLPKYLSTDCLQAIPQSNVSRWDVLGNFMLNSSSHFFKVSLTSAKVVSCPPYGYLIPFLSGPKFPIVFNSINPTRNTIY